MKKSQLKKLIKEVIKEMRGYRRGDSRTATLENYNIYIEDAELPGITQEPTEMEISADINYEFDMGEPARGMFGPPEHSSPGYDASVDILDGEATEITLYPQGKPKITVDYHNQMTPEQQKVVQQYVNAYVESEKGQKKISQKVMGQEQDEPDTTDYWDREESVKEQEKPDYGNQLKNAFKKASKEGNIEAMAYYGTMGNTSASVPFEQFKGSWAYGEWLKKSETQQAIQRIQDEMKRFSYLKENKYNQYIQKKKTLLSLAQKLTENMKQTAKKEFGV